MTKRHALPVEWDLAGMVDSVTGDVDRPVPFNHLRVPNELRLDGDNLRWGGIAAAATAREVLPGRSLLTDFIRLATSSSEEVAKYARQWGVLGICDHDLPSTHNPRPTMPYGAAVTRTWCSPRRDLDGFWEPVAVWQELAFQARAILNIAAGLHLEQDTRPDDWQRLHRGVPERDAQRLFLSFATNRWLLHANARLLFSWRDTPLIHVSGPGLFGALALQLVASVATVDGLAFCTGCANAYSPRRRPRADQRHYCPGCRASGVPQRDAARDHRSSRAARLGRQRP